MTRLAWFALLVTGTFMVGGKASAQLVISEFRWRGTAGALDELVEIYNNSNSPVTVSASGSGGFALAASDGVVRFTIPNGTVIPARGHYLGCNSSGYSVGSYPAGNGTLATCNATYTANISGGEDPDGGGPTPPLPRRGIALFRTAAPASFTIANRLDALGSTEETNTLYKEGAGVRNLLGSQNIAYSLVRRLIGGCIGTARGTVDANCTDVAAIRDTPESSSPFPQDSDDNRADFIFVDTMGTSASPEGIQQRLGTPGPENLSSPITRNSTMKVDLVDPNACVHCPPNEVRDSTVAPNANLGSLYLRRKIINNTGANVTRLRFRIVDVTTYPSGIYTIPAGGTCSDAGAECAADLRALTSTDVTVALSAGGTAIVRGVTLEQAASPEDQPAGGGFNSTLSLSVITLGTPLANGSSINVQFRLGVQQNGTFRFAFNVEVLP